MALEHWTLAVAERCYGIMLSLYPEGFRIRFRNEMLQVFRDCCRDESRRGSSASLLCFVGRAVVDLALSIPRERGRVLLDVRELQTHAGGIIDSAVILSIIAFHLLAAGAGIALCLPRAYETSRGFIVVAVAMGSMLGGLGVICSLMLARARRIQYRLINL